MAEASGSITLAQVARRLEGAGLLVTSQGPLDVPVAGVSQDSRQISAGDLFLAWRGVDHDAHDFVGPAVEAGATAAIVEKLLPNLGASQLQVSDGRRAGALAADTVMGSPWSDLFLAGVTGTNGKTTVAVLTRHLLTAKGPAWSFGTLGLVDESGRIRPGTEGLTTPGPVQISAWLREGVSEGVASVAMEASSHALAQHRLDGLRLDVAAFTNLTQDHLDYHRGFQEYLGAKARILELLKPGGWAVVNLEERAWQGLSLPGGRTLFFGLGGEDGVGHGERSGQTEGPEAGADTTLLATRLRLGTDGSRFTLRLGGETAKVDLPLLGTFNIQNALTAAALARVAGMELEEIARGLSAAPQVPGRLQRVADDPVTVLIDYAHTPDALRNVLQALRPLVAGRLLVLFGAGGDRDKGKRPLMGEVAADLADLSFVTSDNPRTEDPEVIIQDVVDGMGDAPLFRFADRREAVGAALEEAEPGDLVLLAGKGHETYQVIGLEKRPFDEEAIVLDLLGRAGEVDG